MLQYRIITVILGMVGLIPLATHAETLTLAEALALTYQTNPQLDAQRAALRATDEGVAEANAGWRPQISVSGSYGYETFHQPAQPLFGVGGISDYHPTTGDVSVTEPLFRGGRTYAEISKAKALVKAGRAQLAATEESVLLSAVTAYMDVVRDEATVNFKRNAVSTLQTEFKAAQEGKEIGELTRTDVAQSQARLSGAEADLVTTEGQLAVSRSNFEHVIGRPAETLEDEPSPAKLPADENAVVTAATQLNPQLVAARETARASDYAVDDAIGALMPQLSVSGQYVYTQGSPNNLAPGTERYTTVLGQVTVPIYQGGSEEAAVRQAKQQRSQAEYLITDSERQATDAAHSAWQAYTAAEAAIHSNEAQLEANRIAFEGVKREQQIGSRTVLDVLNAEQEMLNSEVAVVQAKHDAVVAAYGVLSAMGQLTAQGLALKVQIYDPKAYYDDNESRWFGLGD
jgi:outer membrane protein